MQELGPDPFPEQLTRAIYSTDKRWPPVGDLIIEVNPGTEKQKTLLPQKLVSCLLSFFILASQFSERNPHPRL